MKKKSALITSLLLSGLVIICASCNGQASSKDNKNILPKEKSTISSGDTVSEMDKGIMSIFQDQQDNYWFGSKEQGVYKYDGKTIIHFTEKDGLCNNRIRSIQEDQSGNIYFDTGEGISQFDGQIFRTLNASKYSNGKWQLKPDDLWFEGKWGKDGLYRYDEESLHYMELPKHELEDTFYAKYPNASFSPYDVYKIFKDSKGHIWFGTANFGACRYNGESFSWISEKELIEFEENEAPGCRSIMEDKDGYIWLSANVNHKYKISSEVDEDGNNKFRYEQLEGIDTYKAPNMNPYFMAIAEDENDSIWMATYDSGVWRYDNGNLTHYAIKSGDNPVQVFTIYKDKQGTLWLGTHNAGALRFNGVKFVPFNP